MKQVVNVKKIGSTVVIYVDPTTDLPVSINSFDDEPEMYFPRTVGIGSDTWAMYNDRYQLNYLERAPVSLPSTKRAKIPASTLEALKRGEKNVEELVPMETDNTSRAERPPSVFSDQLRPKMLKELEFYFVKLSVAQGRKEKELRGELSAVVKFISRVAPELQADINSIEDKYIS